MSYRRFFMFGGRLLLLTALLGSLAWGQRTDYSKPNGPWYNFLAPYQSRSVAPPSFANSPRVDQLVKNGKLYLSLNDAITLALENNLDLAIARYNLDIAHTDLLLARAGGTVRGVVRQRKFGADTLVEDFDFHFLHYLWSP